jgi:hypothetical protein
MKKIITTAVLKSIAVGFAGDNIVLSECEFDGNQLKDLDKKVKEKAPILLTLKVNGEEDDNFPPIQVGGTISKLDCNVTCTTPKFDGLKFSADQVAQIVAYVRGKDPVIVEIEKGEAELFDEDQTPDDES